MNKVLEDKLKGIQDQLANWLDDYIRTNVVPAVMFTADGKVVFVHYTGETEVFDLSEGR